KHITLLDVRLSAPSLLEFLARALCRRRRCPGLPRPAGEARLRRQCPAVLLLAGRLRPADPDGGAAARAPEGERCLAGGDHRAAARGSPAAQGRVVARRVAGDGGLGAPPGG